jgi:hypothetical protein
MLFSRKSDEGDRYQDPATRYGRILRAGKEEKRSGRDKPSLLARLFGLGTDSDFVYYED